MEKVKTDYIRIVLCRRAGEYLSEKDLFLPMSRIKEVVDYMVDYGLYHYIDRAVERYVNGDYEISEEELQFLLPEDDDE